MHGSDSHMGRVRQEDIDPVLKFLKSHSFIHSFIGLPTQGAASLDFLVCLIVGAEDQTQDLTHAEQVLCSGVTCHTPNL